MRILTIEQMKERKQVLGYSNEQLSILSGVPESTIQKIFSGTTKYPRRQTLVKLDAILKVKEGDPYVLTCTTNSMVAESTDPYYVPKKHQGEYTIADYESLPDERRVELIDGVIYDLASPSAHHQIIVSEIAFQLKQYIRMKGGKCIPFSAPTDVQIDCDQFTIVQPDVFIVCNRNIITKKRIFGAPDFVAEILSPATRKKDIDIKFRKYLEAGVGEYWIVDPDKERIVVYHFANEDDYIPKVYTFSDQVPVNIFGGDCHIDFKEISDAFSFMAD